MLNLLKWNMWGSQFLWLGFLSFSLSASQLWAEDFPYQAKVTVIEDLTHNVKRIRLELAKGKAFNFKPGQYVYIQVPDDYIKEWNKRYQTSHKVVTRPYSFASTSSKLPFFDFIIKHYVAPRGKDVPPGLASTYIHTRLREGDKIDLKPPTGQLYLRRDTGQPIIVVAGGVGISPFVCLLEYWFENRINRSSKISLFFGVRSKRDLILHEQFIKWAQTKENFDYIPALSHPAEEDHWKGETGYINQVLERHLEGSSDADAYLAGPPIMIRETVKVLHARGITNDQIHHDPILVR